MKHIKYCFLALGLVIGSSALADRVPENSLPLSAIVQGLEAKGLGDIESIRVERGAWRVRIRQGNQRTLLRIDPVTSEIITQNDEQPLSR